MLGIGAAAAAATSKFLTPADASTPNRLPLYTQNRAPLQPSKFLRLPPGSVKARGWLAHQLQLQVDGLAGRLSEISDYLDYDNCGWVDPTKGAWEELPYWLRDFGDLGYVTGDKRVLDLSKKWIDGIIDAQQPDGWFGPNSVRTALDNGPDMWPHMLILNTLQSYYDYGSDSPIIGGRGADPRVLPFMTKYFHFVDKQPDAQFSKGWGSTRWADNLDALLWLYNRTGDDFLLTLATRIHKSAANWLDGIPTWHNVNISQGFREGAQYWQISGDPAHLAAASHAYDTVMSKYGQFPGGGFAGDENCRDGYVDARQGFETCGWVELMRSFEILTCIGGDPIWADRCEEIAFNSLPAAFDPEQKGLHYITSANCVDIDNRVKTHHQFDNNFAMQAYMPGIHNYRCCPHNYGIGWPNYVETLWLATPDRGLCASMYSACEVTARVADGQTVKIIQQTDYPFDDTIRLFISIDQPTAFPLHLRIPGWCHGASIKVNGKHVDATPTGGYAVLNRTWTSGDRVELHLPMTITVRRWPQNGDSATIDHGPLTYSLKIDEQWTLTNAPGAMPTPLDGHAADSNDSSPGAMPAALSGHVRWPEYTVTATSPWNYALVDVDPAALHVDRKHGHLANNPFTHATTPITIRAKARRLATWTVDDENVIAPVPASPAMSTAPVEEITLIPMAAARLRITSFPVTG